MKTQRDYKQMKRQFVAQTAEITPHLVLRIHQGKKRCLSDERQRPRIDYFLRKGSNQSSEAQQLDHSLQCIITTVMEDVNPSTEITTVEQTSLVEPTQPPRPVERRLPGHRPHVKWPGADKKLWQTVNTDLTLTLEQLQGTLEKKLERIGDVIYKYGAEHFGRQEVKSAKKGPTPPVSRRQQEIKLLAQERRQLRKQ